MDTILKLNENCDIKIDPNRSIIKISTSGMDLLEKMLSKDPEARPAAATLINHTWFVNMRS